MALQLNPLKDVSSILPCTPNLMPFSINYTGPAPVSTYLRILPASDRVGAPKEQDASANTAADALASEPDASTSSTASASNNPAPLPLPLPSASTRAARFVSRFRGRAIQGVSVAMPAGYSGVVLTSDGTSAIQPRTLKTKIKERIKKVSGRATRSSHATSIDSQDEDMDSEDEIKDVKQDPVKTLTVVSQFNSFVLWNPDIPVDEGRDDYMRSLNEWIRISEVVRSLIPCC